MIIGEIGCNWQVKDQPKLTWNADAHEFYTLVMNGTLRLFPTYSCVVNIHFSFMFVYLCLPECNLILYKNIAQTETKRAKVIF